MAAAARSVGVWTAGRLQLSDTVCLLTTTLTMVSRSPLSSRPCSVVRSQLSSNSSPTIYKVQQQQQRRRRRRRRRRRSIARRPAAHCCTVDAGSCTAGGRVAWPVERSVCVCFSSVGQACSSCCSGRRRRRARNCSPALLVAVVSISASSCCVARLQGFIFSLSSRSPF